MAKRNYLVEGLSGAGKSSVYEELIRRGYKAISTDRAWKYQADPDTGFRGGPIHHDDSMWDEQKAVGELARPEPEVLFVCGSSRNRDRFLSYFTKIFNLRIDDDTMRHRLQERTNNEYGKRPEELELMLRLNRSDERPAGAIDVDATQPLEHVVDELFRLADCNTETSDSPPAPWARGGSAIGRSFAIPESALPIVWRTTGDFWDVLDRDAITRFEYAWSGHVLATLFPYLDQQASTLRTLTTMRRPRRSRTPERARSLSSRQITVTVTWHASIQARSTGQRCAATTRSSTRRQQRASSTQCWTGSLSFVTRSRLSTLRSWPCSSSAES